MKLQFKSWMEMADYGFDSDSTLKPTGGPQSIEGDGLFKKIDGSLIIDELTRFPAVGTYEAIQKFHDLVEWGEGPGALQIKITPLGSMKVVVRRLTKDLIGEDAWICKKVYPLKDNIHLEKEIQIAHKVYENINEISQTMVDSANNICENFDKLAWKIWSVAKRKHPSYCLFPVSLRQQNENYFKMIFEFKGQGVEKQGSKRVEQFNIDLNWDKNKGLIRCWGYDIDSTMGQHSWKIQPSEWDELFSPNQKQEEIIECIINTFNQY